MDHSILHWLIWTLYTKRELFEVIRVSLANARKLEINLANLMITYPIAINGSQFANTMYSVHWPLQLDLR
jgi:hypothetical protein